MLNVVGGDLWLCGGMFGGYIGCNRRGTDFIQSTVLLFLTCEKWHTRYKLLHHRKFSLVSVVMVGITILIQESLKKTVIVFLCAFSWQCIHFCTNVLDRQVEWVCWVSLSKRNAAFKKRKRKKKKEGQNVVLNWSAELGWKSPPAVWRLHLLFYFGLVFFPLCFFSLDTV